MSTVALTDQQQRAVDYRGGSLIVSAAAGSGKTAVLVQRVLNLITDPNCPCGVDELVVVTFTNAAAAEMRSKISDELHRRLAEQPENGTLRRQLALLGSSRIQTVHAFCQSLLREHFSLCGVDPDFRLADETQCALLKEQAISAVLERAYAENQADFRALCANLTDGRSDRILEQTVLSIYERLRSHPDPELLLTLLPKLCAGGPEDSSWGRFLKQVGSERLAHAMQLLTQVCAEAQEVPEVWEKYGSLLENYLAYGEKLQECIRQSWDSASQWLEHFEKGRLPSCRYADKDFLERIKSGRDRFAKTIADLKKEIFFSDVRQAVAEGKALQPMAEALCRLVQQFTEEYQALKHQKNLLDFSDLEHLALSLLQQSDGSPTPLAKELRQGIRELLVDEYQDTNEIQERIFSMLRNEGDSAFYVGDVKQSIYGFRLADPAIFMDRYTRSAPCREDTAAPSRLSLNRNFRSRQEVLELCNYCFSRLMSGRFGGVDYDEEQRLTCENQPGCIPSEVLILDDSEREDALAEEHRSVLEARLTAKRVRKLLMEETVTEKDGTVRNARPEDVAILLSSFSSKSPVYQKELLREKIPCGSSGGAFFGTIEISVMLSLLRLIWNRRQDIPLVSVLRSPLYLCTPDLLARLRIAAGDGDLIDGLNTLGKTDALCAKVLSDLDGYCESALEMPLSALLRQIYSRTGAESIFAALDEGPARVRNLHRLEELTRPFDGASGGLGAFLRWIDRKLLDQRDLESPEGENAGVQLMSIHHSKGLEYPFVIVPDLAKQFNTDDLKRPVMFHPNMGIGLRLRKPEEHAEYRTQLQQAIIVSTRSELRSEELRKLYVAMTRAKQKLILVMSKKSLGKHIEKIAQETGGAPSPTWLASRDNAMDWLLAALLTHPACKDLRSLCRETIPVAEDGSKERLLCKIYRPDQLETLVPEHMANVIQLTTENEKTQTADKARLEALAAQSWKSYGHLAAAALPSKLTPTGLKKLIPETGEVFGTPGTAQVRGHHPVSLHKPNPEASARGTAMHQLLRYAELPRCKTTEGVIQQAQRLYEHGYLTEEQMHLLLPEPVTNFACSALEQRAENAYRVLREYQFSVLLDAETLLQGDPKGEKILLNGAIDLLLFEEKGLTIVDFKTDRVTAGKEAEAARQHSLQLSLYQRAAEEVFGLPVKEKWVWFLRTGTGVLLQE